MIFSDIILCFIFLIVGILIGMNIKQHVVVKEVEIVPKDVEKLREELIVYKNLKKSLMDDVRFWRDKAQQK